METVYYTKRKLKKAYDSGEVSAIACVGGTVKFMFKDEPETVGYLVRNIKDKSIIRFKSDEKAWVCIEKIKGLYI